MTVSEIENINDFLKKLTEKNIKFKKQLKQIYKNDTDFFNYFYILNKDIAIFLDIAKEYDINFI